jgi:hypothetical protein
MGRPAGVFMHEKSGKLRKINNLFRLDLFPCALKKVFSGFPQVG